MAEKNPAMVLRISREADLNDVIRGKPFYVYRKGDFSLNFKPGTIARGITSRGTFNLVVENIETMTLDDLPVSDRNLHVCFFRSEVSGQTKISRLLCRAT